MDKTQLGSRHKKGVEPTYVISFGGSGLPVAENQVKPTLTDSMDVNADDSSATEELSRFPKEENKSKRSYVMSLMLFEGYVIGKRK